MLLISTVNITRKDIMFVKYIVTILFAFLAFIGVHAFTDDWQVQNGQEAVWYYGAIFSLAFTASWWNLMATINASFPSFLEKISIPLAAIALGINSAYYHISFKEPALQALVQTPLIQYLWLGVEIGLILGLIIGIYRRVVPPSI